MNKLKLSLTLKTGEILSREELKKILGGAESGSGSENCVKLIWGELDKPCCDPTAWCMIVGSTSTSLCVTRLWLKERTRMN